MSAWAARWITGYLIGSLVAACVSVSRTPLMDAATRGDVAAVRSLVARGADPNVRDEHGETALMLATRYGDAALVSMLLAHHADPRLANQAGATALHWAIDDLAKADALLAAGADPNAVAASGYTPLMLAAVRDGGGPVVQLLLEHGADARGATRAGMTATILAAGADPGALKHLIDHGGGADARIRSGYGGLHAAAIKGQLENVRLLLEEGADVNARDGQGRTPIMWAAQMGWSEIVTVLLEHGANPSLRETFSGTTAVMQAAASDRADVPLVSALLAAGADPNPLDEEGAAAATWAERRGDPEVVRAIRARDATLRRDPIARSAPGRSRGAGSTAQALSLALPLLERTGPAYRAEAGCPSCHHTSLPAMALGRARDRGWAVDTAAQLREAGWVVEALRPLRDRILQGIGFADIVEPAYFLAGLDAAGYPRDDMTDAMARYLALRQGGHGGWRAAMQRMPIDGSDVSFTALAIRGLARYAPPSRAADTRARIERARAFLRDALAHTTEDLAFKALGLHWAGASASELAPTIAALLATQRADGGFAQRGALASDAYATGEAIVALRDAGGLPARTPAIQRAVRFLLSRQEPDGSWFVATRALPFQPFFDTGFPHGRSQFISAAATAWATMALAAAAE